MTQTEFDRRAFELAQSFMLELGIPEINQELLDKYMRLPYTQPRRNTIPDIYYRLLESASNSGMRPRVIWGALDGLERLGQVLDDFNPEYVIDQYASGWERLLEVIITELKPTGAIRRTPRSIWPQFCRTIISAAHFTAQFESAEAFYQWGDSFDMDDHKRLDLPKHIQLEVHGFGFALACDFLKELGYLNFSKPDVHIRVIFDELGLCSACNDYQLFNAVARVAQHAVQSPYAVDKIFWLAASGNFYEDKHIGKDGRVGNHRQAFIRYAKARLSEFSAQGEEVSFRVAGLPPRKGYDYSLWNPKNPDWERVKRLRQAAAHQFRGRSKLKGNIGLSIRVHAPNVGAGDLANFVNGVCDALQAATIHMQDRDIALDFLSDDAINARRAIAYDNDRDVTVIHAESVFSTDEPWYEVTLRREAD